MSCIPALDDVHILKSESLESTCRRGTCTPGFIEAVIVRKRKCATYPQWNSPCPPISMSSTEKWMQLEMAISREQNQFQVNIMHSFLFMIDFIKSHKVIYAHVT